MKLNKLTEMDVERLLDVLLNPEEAKKQLQVYKDARAAANQLIADANDRQADLAEWQTKLEGLDASFDGARKEMADMQAALDGQRKDVERREASILEEMAKHKQTEAMLRSREALVAGQEKALAQRSADMQSELDVARKVVDARLADANSKMAAAQKLADDAASLQVSLKAREADLRQRLG